MKTINLSINPSYHCNFRCKFCYLTEQQLSDRNALSIEKLASLVSEIKSFNTEIRHIDLYGGEIGLLSYQYLKEIERVLSEHGSPKINVITNLSLINPFFLQSNIDLSVSFDFDAREKHELVIQNILKLGKPISILILASPKVLKMNPNDMIRFLNLFSHIKSVEIKPYSQNQANQHEVKYSDYEKFIKEWIASSEPKKFEFVNEALIFDSLDQATSSYSDDHVYITPEGRFAVLEFDSNDNEYFLSLNSFSEYFEWSEEEKRKVSENSFCQQCKYKGHCLTEHYRTVQSLEFSCNGFKHLLDWAEGYFDQSLQVHNNPVESSPQS